MHENEQERLGASAPEPRVAWLKPEVDKVVAGGAEAGDNFQADSLDFPS